jgi:RNA polymerase sigma-70 factor (ECF subfamily)
MLLHARRRAVTMRWVRVELKQGLLESLPDSDVHGDLDGACNDAVAAIEAAHPMGWVEGGRFGRYLARRMDPGVSARAALAELWVADLYLTCAVIDGVRAALLAFDRVLLRDIAPALRSIAGNAANIDETLQLVREKLLVPTGGALRLESYSGHGPLGGWLRVSALRVAISEKRRARPEVSPEEDLEAILDLSPNAEIKVLAREASNDLRAALGTAIAAQPARIRAVLRMYYVAHHGVEDIGRVYNVHASTVSRWLAKAREDILAHTREHLVARLQTSQVDSLLGHAASLEISIESLLRSRPV